LKRLEAKESDGDKDVTYIQAVRAKVTPAVEDNPARSSLNRKLDHPRRTRGEEICLAGWIGVGGVGALTLFGSGSNTDMLSPSFMRVSKTPTRKLEKSSTVATGDHQKSCGHKLWCRGPDRDRGVPNA
jgi:hypothetical protein